VVDLLKGKAKRMSIVLILLFLFGPLSLSKGAVDRIVAIVNQEIITLSEVDRLIDHLKPEIAGGTPLERRGRIQELSRKALDKLIEEKLIDQEAKKSGIKASPKEIDGAIEEIKKRNSISQEDLEQALSKDGLTLETFKKELERRIIRTKQVQWAVKVEPNVGEKELREFYQKNADRYRTEEIYRPAHILFKVSKEAPPEEVRQVRAKCEKVLAQIRAGEDFGEMAIIYSEDPSSKDKGDLGFFKRGELLPLFEREVLRLKVGEITGIIRTEFGFHLIKLLDRKGGHPLPFEEVKERVRQEYLDREFERSLRQYLESLKAKSIIEIKL